MPLYASTAVMPAYGGWAPRRPRRRYQSAELAGLDGFSLKKGLKWAKKNAGKIVSVAAQAAAAYATGGATAVALAAAAKGKDAMKKKAMAALQGKGPAPEAPAGPVAVGPVAAAGPVADSGGAGAGAGADAAPGWMDQQMIPNVPNKYLAIGGAAVLLGILLLKK